MTAWTGGWPFAAIWLAAACAVALEWIAMTGARPDRALGGATVACLAALQITLLQRAFEVLPLIALAGAVAVVGFGAGWRDRAWALSGLGYAAAIALVPVVLRGDPALGAVAILWMFAVVWSTDIVAYFTGRPRRPQAVARREPQEDVVRFRGRPRRRDRGWARRRGRHAGRTSGTDRPRARRARLGPRLGREPGRRSRRIRHEAALRGQGFGRTIPGHGGFMDRLDGFAAVAALIGVALVGSAVAHWPARP